MRVAIVQSETRIIGGIERITETLLLRQNWREVEPYVAFLRPGPMVDRVSSFFPEERTAVFDAGRLRQVHKTIATIAAVGRQLRRWKINVVLSQGFHSQCYGGPAARLAGAKNVFWCHSLLGQNELRNVIARLSVNLPVDLALGNCLSTVEGLRQLYGSKCAVELLYPCAGSGPAQKCPATVREALHIPADAVVVTVVARLQPWKGQEVFLRAAGKLNREGGDAYFLVVGGPTFDADREYETQLKRLAADLGVDGRVRFTGEREDVADLLGASDVVVHSSVAPEPFGMVIVEAMMAGKPVIAVRAGGPSEIISEGRTGFLTTPGDHQELATRLAELIRDSELRCRIGRSGREDAIARFSPERMTGRLEDIFHMLVHLN